MSKQADDHGYRERDATLLDVVTLFENLREADFEELKSATGNPYRSIKLSFLSSMLCKAIECDDGLVCLYGVAPISWADSAGSPWMLGTKLLDGKHKRAVLLIGKECLASMRALFPCRLENHTDIRNYKSIRWLKWLGFRFDEPVPFGISGAPFYPFFMTDDKSCAGLH